MANGRAKYPFFESLLDDEDKAELAKLTGGQKVHFKMRRQILGMYGRACALCPIIDRRVLTLDHVSGGGNRERRGSVSTYRLALSEHRPDVYRILCHNCQHLERTRLGLYGRQGHGTGNSSKSRIRYSIPV